MDSRRTDRQVEHVKYHWQQRGVLECCRCTVQAEPRHNAQHSCKSEHCAKTCQEVLGSMVSLQPNTKDHCRPEAQTLKPFRAANNSFGARVCNANSMCEKMQVGSSPVALQQVELWPQLEQRQQCCHPRSDWGWALHPCPPCGWGCC